MICGIILAAGDSSRMGMPKAMLDYNGKTFLDTVCANMRIAGIYDITVVLGKSAHEIQKMWSGNCERVVINEHPENGQISSLRTALKHMPDYAASALVALVDQPAISDTVYKDLCDAWAKNPGAIVIPRYEGKRGHPIILDAAVWPLCLGGPLDKGLHWVTHHETVKIIDVDVSDIHTIRDVDTPCDYEVLTGKKLNAG